MSADAPDPRSSSVTFDSKRSHNLLWALAGGLVGIHVVLNLIHYATPIELPWLSRQIFDVDEEDSFPTWFSTMLLMFTALSCWLQSRRSRTGESELTGQWLLLALGFMLLSIDEIAGMHETLNSVVDFSWTIPAAIVAAMAGGYFIPFLLKLPRHLAVRFALGGAIYLGGALGVEVLTDPYLENDELNTLAYNLWTAVEEFMEMAGVIVFLGGVWRILRQPRDDEQIANIRLEIR